MPVGQEVDQLAMTASIRALDAKVYLKSKDPNYKEFCKAYNKHDNFYIEIGTNYRLTILYTYQ